MTAYTNRKLGMKASDFDRSIEDLTERHRALVNYAEQALAATQEELEQVRLKASAQGLNVIALRNALCHDMDGGSQSWIPPILGAIGSSPWEEREFDYFLQDRDIELEKPSANLRLAQNEHQWADEVVSHRKNQIFHRKACILIARWWWHFLKRLLLIRINILLIYIKINLSIEPSNIQNGEILYIYNKLIVKYK